MDGLGRWRRRRRAAIVPLLALLLSGGTQCSYRGHDFGGGGGGSSGAVTTIAPITNFGSVFVAGAEYASSGAALTVDGVAAAETQLRPGQIASVTGSLAAGATRGTAGAIGIANELIGPVTATDVGAGSFTVLGQTVRLDGDTSVGATIVPSDVAGLRIGDQVVVDGYRHSGGLLASRLDRAGGQSVRVAGVVAGLDGFSQTFTLAGTTVDYSAASGGIPAGLADGSYVIVGGGVVVTATRLRAGSVALATESRAGANGDSGRVRGIVTRFASSADFDVAGQPVSTGSATVVTHGTLEAVALDRVAEVAGQYDRSGTLAATSIDLAAAGQFRVVGPIDALSPSAKTLRVAGITLATDARTRWDDQGPLALRVFAFGNLSTGDWVEVRGVATGNLAADARILERRVAPIGARVELQDVPAAVASPTFTLAGVTVDASAATFQDATGLTLARSSFFGAAAQHTVRVRGSLVGATLVAASAAYRP